MAADLPTAAAIQSPTVTNAQQKLNLGAIANFLLGYLGAKFGIGPQTVASAASVDLDAVTDTRDLVISGAAVITGFVVEAGKVFRCRASGAFTLTNNSAIVTQRGANILAAAGDTFILRATAADTVEVLCYTRGAARSMVRVNTANGYGSTNTVIRRFTNVVTNQGGDITYADSPTLGASFTINTSGVYAISYSDSFNTASGIGPSLNSNQLTTIFGSITVSDRLNYVTTPQNLYSGSTAVTAYLSAGDVIRAHADGSPSAGSAAIFTITRVD